MKIKADTAALAAFLDGWEDAELLGEKGGRREYVADFYDLERPVSMDLILGKDAFFVDGAAYMSYDEELDGWYIDQAITEADEVLKVLREAGAL